MWVFNIYIYNSGHGICNGNGTNGGDGTCSCEYNYRGDGCESCNRINNYNIDGFYGNKCDKCEGYPNICSGHGSCDGEY